MESSRVCERFLTEIFKGVYDYVDSSKHKLRQRRTSVPAAAARAKSCSKNKYVETGMAQSGLVSHCSPWSLVPVTWYLKPESALTTLPLPLPFIGPHLC